MVGRAVFGDVDGGAAILAPHGHALQDAQQDEHDGAEAEQLLIVRQQTDSEGSAAHDDDGGEEGALAAEAVAHAAEDQRAERAEQEARRKNGERREQRVRLADLGGVEEFGGKDAGERAIDEEVIPFERSACGRRHHNGAQRRRWLYSRLRRRRFHASLPRPVK